MLDDLDLHASWITFIPSRLGHNDRVDVAASVLVKAYHSFHSGHYNDRQCATRSYVNTMAMLRSSLDLSDGSLMIIALLTCIENLLGAHAKAYFVHWQAVANTLLNRPPTGEVSEFSRAMAYAYRTVAFRSSIALGVASPFDESRWIDLEPAEAMSTTMASPGILKLKQLNYKLFVRLPRLIALVRLLRNGDEEAPIQQIAELASQLLLLEDRSAENALLHQVRVIKTVNHAENIVVPYSFEFRSIADHGPAIFYWEARLILIGLCLTLLGLQTHLSTSYPPLLGLDMEKLKEEQLRAVSNIFMSVQYAFGRGMVARQGLNQAFTVCWGALSDMEDYRGVPLSVVRYWILQKAPHAYGVWIPNLEASDLDDLCDILRGGPIGGRLVERYNLRLGAEQFGVRK